MPSNPHPFLTALREYLEHRTKNAKTLHPPKPERLERFYEELEKREKEKKAVEPVRASQNIFGLMMLLLRTQARWATVAVLVVAVGVGLWFGNSGSWESYAGRPGESRSFGSGLPDNLLLNLKRQKLRLEQGKDRLSGTMHSDATNSSPGVGAFSVDLKGRDSEGISAWLHGTAWLTNQPAAPPEKKQIGGVLIRGSFEIPGHQTNKVARSFYPKSVVP